MKKSILAVAGLAAVAGVAAVPAGVYADLTTTQTDSLSITIGDNCNLSYDSTKAHTDGGTSSTPTGTWSGDTLSYTLTNGSADENIGSTKMHIVCNAAGGYDLKLTSAAALTGTTSSSNTIPYITSASAPTSTKSEWGVKSGSSWILKDGKVATSASATAGTDVTVQYGVSATDTQAADIYTSSATYTLSKPAA